MNVMNAARCWRSFAGKPIVLFLTLVTTIYFAGVVCVVGAETMTTKPQLPKNKQTTLGLYVTAAQAYEKWKSAPDQVRLSMCEPQKSTLSSVIQRWCGTFPWPL